MVINLVCIHALVSCVRSWHDNDTQMTTRQLAYVDSWGGRLRNKAQLKLTAYSKMQLVMTFWYIIGVIQLLANVSFSIFPCTLSFYGIFGPILEDRLKERSVCVCVRLSVKVCFFLTKTMGIVKIHFGHYVGKYCPWYWISPHLLCRNQSDAARHCTCYFILLLV